MGPRLVSRGNPPAPSDLAAGDKMLQWGRGLLAAEMASFFMFGYLLSSLQWGRGLLAAEIPLK